MNFETACRLEVFKAVLSVEAHAGLHDLCIIRRNSSPIPHHTDVDVRFGTAKPLHHRCVLVVYYVTRVLAMMCCRDSVFCITIHLSISA